MGTLTTIKEIVPLLNLSPFDKNLNLVGLDSKKSEELLMLLNDILREISPEHNINLEDEPRVDTLRRMTDACAVLGYKAGDDPEVIYEGLETGDKDIVFPVMLWLLRGIEKHRTKAYLARFLRPLQVAADVRVEDSYLQYQETMEVFKETHQQLTTVRACCADTAGIRSEIKKLEQERDTLREKVAKMKRRLTEHPNHEKLFEASSHLRHNLDERKRVADLLMEQIDLLRAARSSLQVTKDIYEDVQGAEKIGTEGHFQQLEEEVKTNRLNLNQELPSEIARNREWLGLLEEIVHRTSITDSNRAQLQQEMTTLRQQIKSLTDKKNAILNPGDDQLDNFRKQVAILDRKRDELQNTVNEVLAQRDQAKRSREEILAQLEEGGKTRMLHGDEYELFKQEAKRKTAEVRKFKAELQDLMSERGILARTRQLLEQRHPNIEEFQRELEKNGGVGALSGDKQDSKLASDQEKNDELQGKSMQELTEMAADLAIQLKEKKEQLRVPVQELRKYKTAMDTLEEEHGVKKREYESAILSIENDKNKVNTEKWSYQEQWIRTESLYHYLNCMKVMTEAELQKVQETALKHADGKTFLDLYTYRLQQQGKHSEMLRARQKIIKETIEPNLAQATMFSDLKKMLIMKKELQQQPEVAEDKGQQEGNVNRMIIS